MKGDSLSNPQLVDNWSLQHFTGGIFFGSLGWLTIWQYVILHSLFEVWENTIGIADWKRWGWKQYRGDSWLNMAGDTLSGTAGFVLTNYIFKGEQAPYSLLFAISALCGLIAYNHPEPADESFFADKVNKGVMTLGVSGVGAGIYYTVKRGVDR